MFAKHTRRRRILLRFKAPLEKRPSRTRYKEYNPRLRNVKLRCSMLSAGELSLLLEGLFNLGVIPHAQWRSAAPCRFQKLTLVGNRQILTDVTKDALKAAPAFEYADAIGRS